MKDANRFHVDIVHTDRAKQDMVTIRMNVDNFDEARVMLENHGFKSYTGKTVNDSSSKSIGLSSPSGFHISLVQHIK